MLSAEERARALRTTVVYAAHPFKRFAQLGMTKDGLRCVGGAERESPIDGTGRAHRPIRLSLTCFAHCSQHFLHPHMYVAANQGLSEDLSGGSAGGQKWRANLLQLVPLDRQNQIAVSDIHYYL